MGDDGHEPLPGTNAAAEPDDTARLRATEIIDTVRGLLDEARMAWLFDEPIDRALDAFECPEGTGYSHGAFLKTVADFTRHVYQHGLRGQRRLSDGQALDEAVALLEQIYQGADADGYAAAAVDAADPHRAGVQTVLAALAEALKARERQAYVRWVVARHIDAAGWDTRCAMAAVLLERLADYLPPELLECPPEQLAHRVFRLLTAEMATERQSQSCFL